MMVFVARIKKKKKMRWVWGWGLSIYRIRIWHFFLLNYKLKCKINLTEFVPTTFDAFETL